MGSDKKRARRRLKYKKMLLTGGSGRLGQAILSSGCFGEIMTPSRQVLDITRPLTIAKFFEKNDIDAVIHCAAVSNTAECEKDLGRAIDINIAGTSNLVTEVMREEAARKREVRFLYISTDGVYPGTRGHYSELSAAMPYNRYGWTKLGGECSVNLLPDHCVIRTSFFDPERIPFDFSATDSYSSKVPIAYLAGAISIMLNSGFIGTINIGSGRISDYDLYRKYKPRLVATTLRDMMNKIHFDKAKDLSLDSSAWRKIEKRALNG
jgi:dTDP-4-dehydrorhamnose reductase